MATEVKLPELGENIESGNVVKVLVSVGQTITKDQPLLELETDKATIEVPSSVEGVIKEIHVKEGAKAQVGQVVVTVDSGEETKEKPAPKVVEQKTEPARKKEEATPAPVETRESAVEEKREPAAAAERQEAPPQKEKAAPASPSVRRLARETGIDVDQVTGTGPGGRITA
ncbi:MAG TPA: biotin/lipoyl-containing protein, partial [Acidobacteriota bacterium]|nr:biotin/lipoyl-containing protein [Acidobacteriota bacterium]